VTQSRILSDYLADIARIRATGAGTGEISYYGALTGALNAAGEKLKSRVFCVPNLRNRGSGFPDMGLFVVPGHPYMGRTVTDRFGAGTAIVCEH